MSDRSAIEWTDSSWNPIRGTKGMWTCTKVSPGCSSCYAERLNVRRGGPGYVVGADEPRLDEKVLLQPLSWRQPRRIFVCSMTDLFGEWVSLEWLARVFNIMASVTPGCGKRHRHEEECWTGPPHTFIVLTKRAERMHKLIEELPNYVGEHWPGDSTISVAMDVHWPLPNVHLGVSCEDQQRADERIPWLLKTPAKVRFVSLEPLLGAIDLSGYLRCPKCEGWGSIAVEGGGQACGLCLKRTNGNPTRWATPGRGDPGPFLDWVIVGGESGGPPERALVEREWYAGPDDLTHSRWTPKAEALKWVREIRDQRVAAKVPFFLKQWGGRTPKSGGRLLDGRTWDEFPQQHDIERRLI